MEPNEKVTREACACDFDRWEPSNNYGGHTSVCPIGKKYWEEVTKQRILSNPTITRI